MSKSSSGGDPSRAETREQCKPLSGLSFLENAPLGNGVLLCALLSFLLLLVSRFPTGLVRFLRFAFPTYSDRGPVTVTFRCLSFASFCRFLLAYCFYVWLRRLWVHAVFKYMAKFTLNYAKAPSSHRGAEGRWRCLRLLVASFGGIHQILSLGPCVATVQ